MKQDKLICGLPNITYNKGYIALWLEVPGLSSSIHFQNELYTARSSFHVSLLCTKRMLNISSETETKILNLFCDFIKENKISFQRSTGELRLVTDSQRERRSIIAMCEVRNLDTFISELNTRLELDVLMYPTHITLYTLGENLGIGIDSYEQLEEKSVVIEIPELLEVIESLK